MESTLILKSATDERVYFSVPRKVADLKYTFNGNILSSDGQECHIKNNIIEYLSEKPRNLTMAQQSNFLPFTSGIYEDTWRKRSIGILSGEDFSIEDEQHLLQRWITVSPDDMVADIGCSTGLYARTVAKKQPLANIVAIDFSDGMLQQAKAKAIEEQHNMYLLRADAQELPFYSNSVDLIVCGGSLNEFGNPDKALYEMKRVLKPDGEIFMMHLQKADTWYGSILQKSSEIGGLHFWGEKESDTMFTKSGFEVVRRHNVGIVCFSLLTRNQ